MIFTGKNDAQAFYAFSQVIGEEKNCFNGSVCSASCLEFRFEDPVLF